MIDPQRNSSLSCGGRISAVRFFFSFLFLFATGLLQGCAIFEVHDLSSYARNERTLYLYNAINSTFQPDVNRELNWRLEEELQSRGNFILTEDPSEARFRMNPEVTVYRKEGRMYDDYRQPTRYTLYTVVIVRVSEGIPGDEKENRLFLAREFSSHTDYSEKEGFIETELQARERLMRKISYAVASAMEEEFLSIGNKKKLTFL